MKKVKRFIYEREKVQRGCGYCADAIYVKAKVSNTKVGTLYREVAKYCPYKKCPYHELDKCKSFAAYLKKMEKEGGTVAQRLNRMLKQEAGTK